jgi:capsular polysaccharide biosynthesis protein
MILPQLYGRDEFPAADGKLPARHEPKALELTEHQNVALIPNNVVLDARTSRLIRPTFSRHPRNFHDGVLYLPKEDAYVTRNPVDLRACTQSDRAVYYADTEAPHVYGHVLLEVVTRLWAIAEVQRNVAIATSVKPDRTLERMLSCLGASMDQVLHIDRPVIVRSGFFPTMAVARRHWIHPAAHEIFDRLRRLAKDSDISAPERIFISRSRVLGRDLVNQRQVEAYFKSSGFVVVHPQDLPIEDQVKLFSSAKLIAGLGGSAMLNCAFTGDAKILILNSEGWFMNSHTLLSQTPGKLAYVFGKPIEAPVSTHRTVSPWRINMGDVKAAVSGHFGLRHGSLHFFKYRAMRFRRRTDEMPPGPTAKTPSWAISRGVAPAAETWPAATHGPSRSEGDAP